MMFKNAMDFARSVVVSDSEDNHGLLYCNNKLIARYKTIIHKENKRNKIMEYKIGDIIKLKNEAGVFQVEIKSKIPTTDAIRGFSDDMVFEGKMRLEIHHKHYGEYIITMTSRKASEDDGRIIVCFLDSCNNEVEYYLGQIIQYEEKEDVFELMK